MPAPVSPWLRSPSRRALELIVSLPAFVVALPVLLILGALVRVSSRGPALFSQTRVGQNQRPFRCHKLRTMREGTPSVATHDAPLDAVTPLGRVLRRTKLDELPQLWNVVRGEMTLVGPRPCLAKQTDLVFRRETHGVYRVAPGITGLAQVRGIDMSTPEACAASDAEYAATASLSGDLRLIFRTVFPRRAKPSGAAQR